MRRLAPETLRRILVVVVALHLAVAAARLVKVGWLRRIEELRRSHAEGPVASALGRDAPQLVEPLERLLQELRQGEQPEWSWILYEGLEGPILERVNALLYPHKLWRRSAWERWRREKGHVDDAAPGAAPEADAGPVPPLATVTRAGRRGLLLLRFDEAGFAQEVLP